MDQAAPSSAQRRGLKHWRRWFLGLCALPLLGFAISNLWLASPWGRGWIVSKIKQRSGLQADIGGASWSPWRGFSLREIVISPPPELPLATPEPLLHITSLRLTPRWRSCFRGRFRVRAVDLESPRLVLSLQMMLHLAKQVPLPATPAALPPLAANQTPRESPPQASPELAQATPNLPQAEPAEPQIPAAPPAEVTPPPKPPSATPPKPRQPTQWVHLRHASFLLVSSDSVVPLVEIADLTCDLPLSGEEIQSSLSLASLKVHGKTLLADFKAPLAWRSPVLSLHPAEATIEGIKLQFAGALALLDGLPLQLEAQVLKQSPAPIELPGGGDAKAGQFASTARFRGLLLAPATWHGDFFAEATALSINPGDRHADFDRGTCVVVLRGLNLSCVDARFVGDNLSLLGNATLLADGRVAGVLRLVAAPDAALGVVNRLFPNITPAPGLTSLSTPQRAACDLEVFGSLNSLQVRLGQDGPIVPFP
jgi:hypothetical protein